MTTAVLLGESSMQLRRQKKRTEPNHQFVDPYEFQNLAVSNRRLVRADDPAAGLRGLLDLDTGTCFVTEEERLFRN